MCKEEPLAVDYFLVKCSALAEVRQPILDSILKCAKCFMQAPIDSESLVQLLDSAGVPTDLIDTQVLNTIKH